MSNGILLLHGFAGTRKDLMPLAEFLEKSGCTVLVPLLAGHELTRKDFAKSKYNDWIKSATDAAAELKKTCDKIIIIGFSMGGMLAVNLCQSIAVEKMALINTPVYYWDIFRIIKNLFCDFKFYFRKYFVAGTNKPLCALWEFQKLLIKTKPLFSNIVCPVLIIQTMDDDTSHPKSADYIYRNIPGKKFLKKYEKGGHMLFETGVSESVCIEITKFIAM